MHMLILAMCRNYELERESTQVDGKRERPSGHRPDLAVEIKKNGNTCAQTTKLLNKN
jgi:hypothetical protein